MGKFLRSRKVIRKPHIRILILGMLAKFLSGDHHGDGGLGNEIVREGTE